jgi:predicted dehydrogenase
LIIIKSNNLKLGIMKRESVNRRGFIRKSAVASAGIFAGAPAYIRGYAQVKPSDVINVAVVGVNGRGGLYGGTGHLPNYTRIKTSRVAAICDPDENLYSKAIADIEKLGGTKPRTVVDFRKLLDAKDIDAVSIASPDYWHALQAIWACQAGKDVYVEKPVCYTIEEGKKIVEAARKYKRIVQTGTGSRSDRIVRKAIQLIHEGIVGEVYMGRGIVFGHRENIGRVPNSEVPQGVNWDIYRGPAPMIPFNKNHFHYNWHWYWDTSTSEFGNNGVHVMDEVRWGMKKDVHPAKIHCCGGFYAYDSDQEIPNLEVATYEFDDGKIMELEVRSLFTNAEEGGRKDCLFYGSKGWMHLGGGGFEVYLGPKNQKGPSMTSKDLEPDEWEKQKIDYHFVNFLECMKSRKSQDLNAEIFQGFMSTSMMHLGNIAYRTGRKLIFDGKTERFVNDEEANKYLSRKYREPYVLPKVV